MGALPGGRILIAGPDRLADWFDVEPFRTAPRRVVVRAVDRALVVLGSTQPASVVDVDRAADAGVAVARRRSGGGAVLLSPGAQLWIDIWVPAGDPLWAPEPSVSAERVGEWWRAALAGAGVGGLSVRHGPSVGAPGSDVICFAGLGPGEVTVDGRKLVGLAQWRSRQGALVHGCLYRRWSPRGLLDVLAGGAERRRALGAVVEGAAVGLDEVAERWLDPCELVAALPDPTSWELVSH